MKKWIWRILAVLTAVYLAIALFVIPYLLRVKVPAIVQEKTGGTLEIEGVSFNPLILNLEVRGVRFLTPEKTPLFALRRFEINVDVVHLLYGKLSIERIGIYGPKLTIVQKEDGTFNFDWLRTLGERDETTTVPEEQNASAALPAVELKDVELEDGVVDFTDLSRPQPLFLHAEPIGLTLTDIDTTGSGKNRIHFFVGTDSGGMLDVKSKVHSFDPLAFDGSLLYNAGKLYLTYHFLQSISTLEVADGRFHAAMKFNVDLGNPDATKIDDIDLVLERLRIISKERHNDVLRLGTMAVSAGPVYPLKNRAEVAQVDFDHFYVAATRLEDGTIDWQHFFLPSEHNATVATKTADAESNASGAAAAPKWQARIGKTEIRNLEARFEDRTLPTPAHLSVNDFNLTLESLSTDLAKPVRFTNRFALNEHGGIEANGSVTPQPLQADADLNVQGLALVPFDPYLEARTFARIERGRIDMNGHVAYAPDDKAADLSATGSFGLHDLLVNDARDTMPLVSIVALETDAYLFELSPNRLFVDTAVMDAFYADVVVAKDKTLNLASVMKPSKATPDRTATEAKAETAGADEPFPVRIVRFIVKNGAVHFADYSLPLQFDTQIHDVNGEVLGISTRKEDTTFLRFDGEIDRYGVARAEGSLNTADPKAYTGIGVDFRNIDLSSFTPYSGKFVGRAIDDGKLAVTLRYHIVNSRMEGDNGIRIKQIKLGRDIESNESVSLPLEFAIALLEDNEGVIDIDMPVEGDVDNPEFKWGGVVWDAFVNLLTKAVTAPFELIGAMLGVEGDELKYVAFEAGSSRIDAASREGLDLLAKALGKRPKLGITLTGTYDKALDGHALKKAALVDEVLGTEHKEEITAGSALSSSLLEPIYVNRMGEEALNTLKKEIRNSEADEAAKAVRYNEALIKALIKSQPLPPDALQTLARARVKAIRGYLEVNHAIGSDRMADETPSAAKGRDGFVATEIGLEAAK